MLLSKPCQYMQDGQTYTPERYRGSGAVRDVAFAAEGSTRILRQHDASGAVAAVLLSVLFAVDRVYADKTLEEFWRHGKLIPNRAHRHPYQKDVPKRYHDSDRWFLLDTNLDPPRPWDMHTNIPVLKPCPGTR